MIKFLRFFSINDMECFLCLYVWQVILYRNVYYKYVLMFGVVWIIVRFFWDFQQKFMMIVRNLLQIINYDFVLYGVYR